MLKRSPPVTSLRKWLRWRSKYEISLPTFKNLPGKTRSSTRNSCSARLRKGRKRTRERVRKEAMLSLDKSVSKNNNKNNSRSNSRSNNKSNAKSKKMGEMKDEFKGRAAKNLDDLIHRTDSPFTKMVIAFPLPSKFRMPSLETFDGSKDPLDHLESFKTMMCLQGVPDEIMCRAFPTTLKGPARVWFKKLMPSSVGSFAQLSRLFFNHFIGGQRYGRPTTHLLNVKQKEGETLRSYLTRFNKETLLVDGADNKVVLTAFIFGLQSGDFLFSVYKDPPSTMTEMMYEAQRYMNGEEALLARDQTTGKKRKWEHADRSMESHETRPKAQRNRNRRREDRSGRGFNERFNHFTPLNALVDHIFMQIRNDPSFEMAGEGRPQGARQQRPPVEALLRPPLGEIHVITGGMATAGSSCSSRKAYARQIHNVLVTQKTDKKPRLEDLPITFTEKDARKVFHPHDDALVVTLEIAGYSTRRVLIDNGSSVDIIYLTAFQQMKIGKDQLRPIETPLVGFAGTSVYPLGMITLQIIAGAHPKQATKKVNFLVIDCPSTYNMIIGRPTLNRLRAVTSTYHLLVHFPTENGIGEMREIKQWPENNADVFAWSHDDMPGISTEVIAHKLNVNPSTSPVKQKRRVFAPERNAAVMKEVDKLLKAGFIREVYYPEWLANVVMVKKSTGKWRMCVDFTDLNKACPKDSYPLPRIDQLVDSTAGHKLLSFMDAFSGYNQIQMTKEDQEKTAFITSRGLFCYKAMPFGLKNAGATYQRLVNKMFHDQIRRNVEALRRYNMKLNPAKCVFGVSSGKFLGFMVSQRGIEANPDKIKVILEMSPLKTVKEVQSLTGKAAALNRFVSRSTDKCLPFFRTLRKAFQWTEECQKAFEELKVYLSSPPLLSPSQTSEELYLYLAVSASTVSSALIREKERIQKPVYYTSRALRGAEERYSNMEKLVFALLIASRKLRPYFQSHPIIVLTNYPLRKAMNKPDAAGRLVQWSIEMSEFHIDYRSRTAIKAQALADFIAEFTQPWKDEGESEEGEAWMVNIDGSSTKEMSGAGIILVSPEKDKFKYALIVGQVKGEYEAKEDRMKKYLTVVKNLLTHFKKVELLQIPREENEAADRLARLASSGIGQKHTSSEYELPASSCWEASFTRWVFHDPTLNVYRQKKRTTSSGRSMKRVPPEEITPITSPWPFVQWGLDIMGPFPVGTKQAKFLVVAIDYFTKWVEAEPLATISEKNIKGFVWKAVICRFGISRVLISEKGKQFDNGPFRELCSQLNIKNHYSSPRHPQANVCQVEVTNRTLLKQIKTRLEGAKSMWVEELPSVLWAYRTTVRTPTKETPFKLTFGTEAVIPVEIGLTTLRTTFHKEEENEGQLRLNLDLLDETREKAAQRIAFYQGKMARYYNTKVKL
uniref:Integrase catalytic domain-containing protein n=1 Tax=Fagus sylvatica TaxID=28930 RepID=A0A2N9FD92_FAGSY